MTNTVLEVAATVAEEPKVSQPSTVAEVTATVAEETATVAEVTATVAEELKASQPSTLDSLAAACCCFKIFPREAVSQAILNLDTTDELGGPSCFQRLCLCRCKTSGREANALGDIPLLRGLTGVTFQNGESITSGSLQTLKWGTWDAEKRVLETKVFGGAACCGSVGYQTGSWTEPAELCPCNKWYFLMNLARLCNYNYTFTFSEDFRQADIVASANCTPCIPCISPWFSIPKGICRCDMVQPESSTDGTQWTRRSAKCGKELEPEYELLEVFTPEGAPGKFHDKLLKAPELVMMTF